MRKFTGLRSLVVTVAMALPAGAAEQAWVTRSNQNAQLLLQLEAKYSPESASSIGIDGYDEAISDYSRDEYEPRRRDTEKIIAEYRKRTAAERDAKVLQDLQILIKAAQDELSAAKVNRKYFFPFIDLTGSIFGVVQQTIDPRIPPERQRTLLARLDKYTGTTKGFRPVSELAKERTLERIKADGKLIGPYVGEIDKVITDGPVMLAGIKDLLAKSKLLGWESRFALLEKQLTGYNLWLKTEILPKARADHRLPP